MNSIGIYSSWKMGWLMALAVFVVYVLTTPSNHSEAEDVYDFALRVEQGTFADQAGVNRVLALPMFGGAYKIAQAMGYSGRAFPFMIFINRLLAVASLFLFHRLFSYRRHPAGPEPVGSGASALHRSTTPALLNPVVLLLAFSYGFWRYANEAETYMLALVMALGAWRSAFEGRWLLAAGLSAVGILIHLLNLIPLLLIIPLYYLLSREWKKAVLHGVTTGALVVAGYIACSPWLDFSELGAQHHQLEAGFGAGNLLRGFLAFGQSVVSGNFLFGFEGFRALLVQLFPSRMLGEEFFMASQMPGWIPVAGTATVLLFVVCGLWFGVQAIRAGRESFTVGRGRQALQASNFKPLTISAVTWLLLYAVAVVRTEAGSPELWIMALVPFWLVAGPVLSHEVWGMGHGARLAHHVSRVGLGNVASTSRASATTGEGCSVGSMSRRVRLLPWFLVAALFAHNLIAGLLPVMSKTSDYHAKKGRWLIENSTGDDLILTDYEPVMVFYLDYFADAHVLNSGQRSLDEIKQELETCAGEAYAVSSFFRPMESMKVRSLDQYEKMLKTGDALRLGFGRIVNDEFGGIYALKEKGVQDE